MGRMFAFAAKKMGYSVIVLDPTPNCPAAQVCDMQITASHYDVMAIRKLAEITDVITYEFEHVDAEALVLIAKEGYTVRPSGKTLGKIQDKYIQKTLFKSFGLPVPEFFKADDLGVTLSLANDLGYPVMLKTRTGGYDGKGNVVVRSENELENEWKKLRGLDLELMIEEYIRFDQEISVMVSRGLDKTTVIYPVAENEHIDSILHLTRVSDDFPEEITLKVNEVANKVMDIFDDVGIFCIEMFLTAENNLFINEVAPRPHNSGHYTIEACVTSQFEQHLRAITGLPLGSPRLKKPAAMVNILGKEPLYNGFDIEGLDSLLTTEEVFFHFYGKQNVDLRKKIGHITALAESVKEAEIKAVEALSKINFKQCSKRLAGGLNA